MHTDGHDMGKETAGKPKPAGQVGHEAKVDAEHPGYETTDVNAGGIAVFLAGLFGFVVIFFFFCYGMGKVINNLFEKEDGAATKWTQEAGAAPLGKGEDLASNPAMQKKLGQVVGGFLEPRLDIDDGNQATADLHAREDLLLEHYSLVDGEPGTVRIPIERAMELIAQRGLPVASEGKAATESLAGATKPEVQAPLTTGFARTGFELTVMEAREQKMNYGRAVASEQPAPAK